MKSDKEKISALEKIIDWVIETNPEVISNYVDKLRQQNKNISNDNLAKKIVKRKSLKNGLVGAATGVGGLLTLPVSIPADLIVSWKIQHYMA